MDYVRLGSAGLKVSRICLGCMSFGNGFDWMLPEEASSSIVRKALDLGINFFDTADVYSAGQSEEILGRALKSFGVKRDDVVVATKVYQAMGPRPNRTDCRGNQGQSLGGLGEGGRNSADCRGDGCTGERLRDATAVACLLPSGSDSPLAALASPSVHSHESVAADQHCVSDPARGAFTPCEFSSAQGSP